MLIDSDQDRLGVRRFQMETWGFAVNSASTAADARDLGAVCEPDLIVGVWKFTGGDLVALLKDLKSQWPHIPSLLVAEQLAAMPEVAIADTVLIKNQCQPEAMRERLKIMSARKRGPRKAIPATIDHMMDLAGRRIA
jgi:DNA-binding response OmpR family regulator